MGILLHQRHTVYFRQRQLGIEYTKTRPFHCECSSLRGGCAYRPGAIEFPKKNANGTNQSSLSRVNMSLPTTSPGQMAALGAQRREWVYLARAVCVPALVVPVRNARHIKLVCTHYGNSHPAYLLSIQCPPKPIGQLSIDCGGKR